MHCCLVIISTMLRSWRLIVFERTICTTALSHYFHNSCAFVGYMYEYVIYNNFFFHNVCYKQLWLQLIYYYDWFYETIMGYCWKCLNSTAGELTINDVEDMLIIQQWKDSSTGVYTDKFGFEYIIFREWRILHRPVAREGEGRARAYW